MSTVTDLRNDAATIARLRAALIDIGRLVEAVGIDPRSTNEDLVALPDIVEQFISTLNEEIGEADDARDDAIAAIDDAKEEAQEAADYVDEQVNLNDLEEARCRWQRKDRREALHYLERALGSGFYGLEQVLQ